MVTKKIDYFTAVGRRKRAVARVKLFKGREPIMINGQPAEKYFPGTTNQLLLRQPLILTDLADKYTALVKVSGSGKTSQLLSVIHGLARAIIKLDSEAFKFRLRAAGLLTRDYRKKQRRMVGTGGKARRKKQSPKR